MRVLANTGPVDSFLVQYEQLYTVQLNMATPLLMCLGVFARVYYQVGQTNMETRCALFPSTENLVIIQKNTHAPVFYSTRCRNALHIVFRIVLRVNHSKSLSPQGAEG